MIPAEDIDRLKRERDAATRMLAAVLLAVGGPVSVTRDILDNIPDCTIYKNDAFEDGGFVFYALRNAHIVSDIP